MQSQYGNVAKALWLKAAKLSKQLDTSLGAIHGLGLAEYMVLDCLVSAPNKSLRRIDIADALGRTGSGVTRMLMPMEKIGLIGRDTNERDARVSLVRLTETGEQLYRDASATLEQKSATVFSDLSESQAKELSQMLKAS